MVELNVCFLCYQNIDIMLIHLGFLGPNKHKLIFQILIYFFWQVQ